ncbi:MAG: hypothetical protein ACLQEQ_05265 [Nitrososphaerales archaeon]
MGDKQRMPKGARYPLFIIGLAILLVGSIASNAAGAGASLIGAVVLVGFVLMILSVAIK